MVGEIDVPTYHGPHPLKTTLMPVPTPPTGNLPQSFVGDDRKRLPPLGHGAVADASALAGEQPDALHASTT
jgi:hypothetical protein